MLKEFLEEEKYNNTRCISVSTQKKEEQLKWYYTDKIVDVFFKDFIYLFLERGEGKGREWERNINAWLPLAYPIL